MARAMSNSAQFSFNAVTIQDELNSVVQTATVPEADITAFNDAWQTTLAGNHKDVKTVVDGAFDPAASAGDVTIFAAIGGATVSTIFDPLGTGPGANAPEYQCTASGLSGVLVQSYRLTLPVADKASYQATLQHSGLTSRAVA